MTTTLKRGSIFASDLQTLVVPVNTVGAMGAGLAKSFKQVYPGLDRAYRRACLDGSFRRDKLYLYPVSEHRNVLCVPTKKHWRDPSKLNYVIYGLVNIAEKYEELGITSLAVPALGCGLGKLQWEEVLPLMQQYLDPLPIDVEIYPPS